MSRLKQILKEYAQTGHYLGGESESPSNEASVVKAAALKAKLIQLKNFHNLAFWASFVAASVLFTLPLACLLRGGESLDWLEKAGAVGGVTLAGLVGAMLKSWKEKHQVDTILLFANSFEKETLNSILTVFLNKI